MMSPLFPGLVQIELPVRVGAAGLELVDIFTVLLDDVHVVVALVPIV